jgi:hypothetical protein
LPRNWLKQQSEEDAQSRCRDIPQEEEYEEVLVYDASAVQIANSPNEGCLLFFSSKLACND